MSAQTEKHTNRQTKITYNHLRQYQQPYNKTEPIQTDSKIPLTSSELIKFKRHHPQRTVRKSKLQAPRSRCKALSQQAKHKTKTENPEHETDPERERERTAQGYPTTLTRSRPRGDIHLIKPRATI